MYKNILVPIKLTHAPKSGGLMEKAIAVARDNDAKLNVVTVVPEIADNLKVLPEHSLPELQKFVDRFDTAGIDVSVSFKTGTSHRAIPRAADEMDCDLIVMNSHNPRISDYFIGSTAGHVVMHASCDVLVVRQGG